MFNQLIPIAARNFQNTRFVSASKNSVLTIRTTACFLQTLKTNVDQLNETGYRIAASLTTWNQFSFRNCLSQ